MCRRIAGCWEVYRNLTFELHKVEREIKVHGDTFEIHRDILDDYGEVTGNSEKVCETRGLFHISKSFVSRSTTDGTTTHAAGSPMLLCLFSGTEQIQSGDWLKVNGVRYNITDLTNVGEQNIVVDMSLERVI